MRCPTCGVDVAANVRFCTNCGNALPDASLPAPQPGWDQSWDSVQADPNQAWGAAQAPLQPTAEPQRRRSGLWIGVATAMVVLLIAAVVVALVRRNPTETTGSSGVSPTSEPGPKTKRTTRTELPVTDLPGSTVPKSTSGTAKGTIPVSKAPADDSVVKADRAAGTPRPGGKLIYALAAESDGFNPANNRWGWSGMVVARAIFDPLAIYDAGLRPQPYLASSLTPSSTFDRWSITLRPGVIFHDGTPLTASAVKTGLEAQRSSPLTGPSLSNVSSIEAPDEQTVVVTMNRSWATFPDVLTSQVGMIASPATYADDSGTKPVGTGPFAFSSWSVGASLDVKRNPSYWQPQKPFLDAVEFRPIVDDQSRAAALETGDADIGQFTDIPSGSLSSMTTYSDAANNPQRLMLALNTSKEPFSDSGARRAVALGIDRTVMPGGRDASGYLGPGSPFLSSAPEASQAADAVEAKSSVSAYKSSTGKALTFTLLVPVDSGSTTTAQLVQSQLSTMGISVKIEAVEQTQLIVSVLTGNYDAALWTMFGGPSPEQDVAFLSSPVSKAGSVSLNVTRFNDPDLSAALDSFRATNDPAEQRQQMATVQKTLATKAPWVFLGDHVRSVVVSDRVHGAFAYDTPDGSPAWPTVETFVGNVWLG